VASYDFKTEPNGRKWDVFYREDDAKWELIGQVYNPENAPGVAKDERARRWESGGYRNG
jgi:hypothetical protein